MTPRTARTAAITTTLLLTTAVPVLLAATDTWAPQVPSPHAVRQWIARPLDARFVVALTATAAATLSLLLITVVLTHAYTTLGRRLHWAGHIRAPGPLQGITAAVLGATAVTTATTGTAHADAATTSSTPDLPSAAPNTAAPAAQDRGPAPSKEATPATYRVQRGDSLARIAARTLGDAGRWPEIFALNRGTHFPHVGGTLRDPNLIYPGWTLTLPTNTTPTPAPERSTDTTPPQHPDPDEPPAPAIPDATPSSAAPTHTPAPSVSPSSHTSAPSDTAQPTTQPETGDSDGRTQRPARGVSLPSGSWVNLGLALAITAAVALLWAHRQHRYVPRTPSTRAHPTDADPAPMPRVVDHIRRGLHHVTAQTDTPHIGEGQSADPDTNQRPPHAADAPHDHQPEHRDNDLDHPDSVTTSTAFTRDDPQSPPWPTAGLGLTGPGAAPAGRGFLTAAFATANTDHPDAPTHVIIPAATAASLLDTDPTDLPRTPRLTITATLDDALTILEAQALHRTRLLQHHDIDTITQLRATDAHDEPLPPVLLIANPTSRDTARTAALLSQGHHLDIHGLLLGTWPTGDTVTVATDGTTTPADNPTRHGPHPADIGRFAVLNPAETVALLTTLTETHASAPQAPAPTDAAPQPDASSTAHAATSTPHGVGLDDNSPLLPVTTPEPDEPTTGSTEPERRADRVTVTVLGKPAIIDADPQRHLRAKSMELLVYLAVRDGNASTEAILDDLLPDAPASKALHRLHTYISDLRAALRHHAGPGTYLTRNQHRYQLHPDRLDIDLWRMRAAIRTADTAGTHHERVKALRRAVETYQPLADGCDYEWLEPYRHTVQREALDAVAALLEELTEHPDQQATVCDTALPHHPYTEALYQHAMRAHARLGHPDTIRALRRTLTRRLAEIDTEPTDDTLTLADQLIADIRQPRRTPQSSNSEAPA
ncbi:BTAD domain-containing putative transcriptional regulator [Micromonospora coxensis]|uniref:LysM domain-containing protein n=1 Tax=Micromonospora coxensis TaxID=356852 RepID=A0A1C5GWJ2_9ACTN|nr:BTAD domain-containing putative transcriptional regulator [Micromonospora coxensis]SCG38162.1 LysM domain-containing protein [Micromonospora coxensis]